MTYGTQFISRDGGLSWEALPFPRPGASVNGAVADGDALILAGLSGNRAMFWFNEAP